MTELTRRIVRDDDGNIVGIEGPDRDDDTPAALLTLACELADARYHDGYAAGAAAAMKVGVPAPPPASPAPAAPVEPAPTPAYPDDFIERLTELAQKATEAADNSLTRGVAEGVRAGYRVGFGAGRQWALTQPEDATLPPARIELLRDAEGAFSVSLDQPVPQLSAG